MSCFIKFVLHLFLGLIVVNTFCQDGNCYDEPNQLAKFAKVLKQPDVAEELEIVDAQLREIEDRCNELKYVDDNFRKIRRHFAGENDKTEELPSNSAEQIRETLEQILLPHQIERLLQLVRQSSLHTGTLPGFGTIQLRKKLKLSAEQISAVTRRCQKLDEDVRNEIDAMREKIRQLRKSAQQEIVDEFDRDQKLLYRELIGEDFIMDRDLATTILRITQDPEQKKKKD